jgi:ADP-ribose pyrophosphatase
VTFADPGFTNTNLILVHVDIDSKAEANQPENLKPELEDGEFISTFAVPLNQLWAECRKLEKEGYAIDARVGTMAEGIEIAKRWRLY